MTSKFEQLIELVINEDEAKAKELFHDIVVEKSREIYESLMQEEDEPADTDLDEAKEEDSEEELDEAKEEDAEEELEEGLEDESQMSSEASDNLIDDVEAEEKGMMEAGDEEEGEFGHEEEVEGEIEDRVIDLEDKLDELMAEFEALMGAEEQEHDAETVSDIDGGDALEMDDTDTADFGHDEELAENVSLAAAPKPTTTEPAGTNTKSTVAFNSGAAGMEGAPVKMTGDTAKGRPAPTAGKISSDKFQNEPATGSKKLSPATKPTLSQAAGVNTKTPFPKA